MVENSKIQLFYSKFQTLWNALFLWWLNPRNMFSSNWAVWGKNNFLKGGRLSYLLPWLFINIGSSISVFIEIHLLILIFKHLFCSIQFKLFCFHFNSKILEDWYMNWRNQKWLRLTYFTDDFFIKFSNKNFDFILFSG